MPNPLDDRAVYTLDDLRRWEELRPGLPPSLAVLGHPVAHSVSPQMHNAALAELAKEYPQLKEWRYFKFDIESIVLDEPLAYFSRTNFKGLNLTIPHKIFSLKFQPNVAAGDIPPASVNTMTPMTNGRWEGVSTDGYGLAQSIKFDLGATISGREIIIFGTGGAARATMVQCVENHCGLLWVGGRKRNEEMQLDHFFSRFYRSTDVRYFNMAQPPVSMWKPDAIVINATSLGLNDEDPSPIDTALLHPRTIVLDMVYRREGRLTALISSARASGLKVTDGLGMLIWQGAKSLTLWLKAQEGIDIQPESIAQTMMDAACDALNIPRRTILP